MLMSLKSCRSPCMWHCHHAAERDARFYPTRDLATQFDRFESNGLQHLGYPSREGLLFADPWCKELKERLLRELRLLDHTIITAAIVQWRSGLNACVCMNGGHFEHKFWASDLLLCIVFVSSILVSVNVIDINMCIVLPVILCEMCYFYVLTLSHGVVAT